MSAVRNIFTINSSKTSKNEATINFKVFPYDRTRIRKKPFAMVIGLAYNTNNLKLTKKSHITNSFHKSIEFGSDRQNKTISFPPSYKLYSYD